MKKISSDGDNSTAAAIVPQTSLSPLWTRKQVADALQVTTHSVARWTRLGRLPCITINRRLLRYDPAVVQAFIRSTDGGAQ